MQISDTTKSSLFYQALAAAPLLFFLVGYLIVRLSGLERLHLPWRGLAILVLSVLVGSSVVYSILPTTYNDVEGGTASISAQLLSGHPVYPPPDAAQRYAYLYGPLLYLIKAPFYLALGENIFAFKASGAIALVLALSALYCISRRYASPSASLLALGFVAVAFFRYLACVMWGQSDPLILMFEAAFLLAVLIAPDFLLILVGGVSMAAIVNFKFTGVSYCLPILALMFLTRRRSTTLITCALAALITPLPFLLSEVSLSNYLFILGVASHHGLTLYVFLRNIQYAFIFALPVIFLVRWRAVNGLPLKSKQFLYLATTAVAMIATSVVASKRGAFDYHLIPFAVPLLHSFVWLRSDVLNNRGGAIPSRLVWAFCGFVALYSIVPAVMAVNIWRESFFAPRIIEEIRQAESTNPGDTIEIGIGEDFLDPRLKYTYVLSFDKQPHTFDSGAIRDLQAGGVPIPVSSVRYLENCGTEYWLIPRGQVPFGISSHFDTSFRDTFLWHYEKRSTWQYFDVWSCIAARRGRLP